jgi:hypothetical protein
MPRAQGDPKSKVIGTTLKEHERDALNEFLRDKKMTRYTDKGYRVQTKYVPEDA